VIIARGSSADDRHLLLLGLSRSNIDKLIAGYPIRLRKDTHEGIPENWDLVILFGETEADLACLLSCPGESAPTAPACTGQDKKKTGALTRRAGPKPSNPEV
jgi:hypothetical protein